MEKLLPCPFCGGQPETWWDYDDCDLGFYNEGFNIKCCIIEFCCAEKEDAFNKWNARYNNAL